MDFIGTFKEVIQRLESEDIRYIIVGSIASMVYGEPRVTRDMDLVIDVRADAASKFELLFPQPDYYCPPLEVVGDEIQNRGQFNLLHVPTGLKVDIMIKKANEFDEGRFSRRRQIELWEGLTAYLAAPEDVILKKLEFYREGGSEKHLRDIRGILIHTEIDKEYLQSWINKMNLQAAWEKI